MKNSMGTPDGPHWYDRIEVESSESPAAPSDDTNTRSGGLARRRTRVAGGLVGGVGVDVRLHDGPAIWVGIAL